ncbi:MAG: nodulation protein NfeD [Bacteroidia bacterium]|nr:nodulation protein NfeD [Bacteroidia bacterium]
MRTLLLLALNLLVSFLLVSAPQEAPGQEGNTSGLPDSLKPIHKSKKVRVYKFNMKDQIGPPTWRQTQEMLRAAEEYNADIILIHMDTYGGEVYAADKIRTSLLKSKIPVYVFIDDNAASAGALISIACDSIYMNPGGTIGSATVVDGSGNPAPEKYQSYMRSRLRSTAEQTGRDPRIAEGMNDSAMEIPGIKERGRVLAFTASEAFLNGYSNGQGNSVDDILRDAGFPDYEIREYEPTAVGKIIDFLIDPVVSSILIMLMLGGLYFEMKSPGIGFALLVSVIAALLYFAPHYLQGLADHWEILVFALGVILLALEIFVIPGFGAAGISGIILMVAGLSLALVDAVPGDQVFRMPDAEEFVKAIFLVVISVVVSTIVSFYLGGKLLNSDFFKRVALETTTPSSEGFIASDPKVRSMVGQTGKAFTILRPSGKIQIGEVVYDAAAETGFIEKDEPIVVVRMDGMTLVVRRK